MNPFALTGIAIILLTASCTPKINENFMASTWGLSTATLITSKIDNSNANLAENQGLVNTLQEKGMLLFLKEDGTFRDLIGSDQESGGTWEYDAPKNKLRLRYKNAGDEPLDFDVEYCNKELLVMEGVVGGLPIRFRFVRQKASVR